MRPITWVKTVTSVDGEITCVRYDLSGNRFQVRLENRLPTFREHLDFGKGEKKWFLESTTPGLIPNHYQFFAETDELAQTHAIRVIRKSLKLWLEELE